MCRLSSVPKSMMWFMASMMVVLTAGCGSSQNQILGAGSGASAGGVPPTVTAVAPLNNATGVAINLKKITAAFSKAMNPATLTTASLTLACPAGTPVTGGSVSYLATGDVATLTLPVANLPIATLCTATVSTAAKDTAGLALANAFVWTFTTGVTADTAKPRVTITVPATTTPGPTTGVATNTAITATFNEDIDPTTIDGTSFTVQNTTLASAVTGTVSYAIGARTATFVPTTALPASSAFSATIASTVTDLAGNALAGGTSTTTTANYVWTFSTGAGADTVAPTVTNVVPADAATLICLNKTLNATFSEAMNSTTIKTATFALVPDLTPGSPVNGVVGYDPLTQIASFNPVADLTLNTAYTATITGGALGVKDVAGNPLAVDKVWHFSTGSTTCLAPVAMGAAATFGISATAGLATAISSSTVNADILLLPPTNVCNATTVPGDGTIGTCAAIGFPPTVNGTVISAAYDPTGSINTVRDAVFATFLSLCAPGVPAANCTMGAPGNIPTNLPTGTTLGAPSGSAQVTGDNYFTPGLYQSLTSILITGDLTLDAQGDANAVFIFQASGPSPTIGTANAAGGVAAGRTRILLVNGAKASNVWWSAASSATIGTFSEFQGNILAAVAITLNNDATSCGRMMAGAWVGGGGAITLGGNNVVVVPGQPFVPPVGYSATCQ